MSTPNVGGLVVYDEDGELSPDTIRYRIVEAAVHLALCLLETSKGRRSMVDVATAIIQERDDHRPQPLHHIYQDDLQNMPNWIRTFLQRMRNDFPAVKIHKAVKGEASAERYPWGNNMNQYIAGEAGVLWMSEAILSNMTYLYENRTIPGNRYSYKLFKFQMVISVAHEIMHFLTGFLTGSVKPSTPKGVTAQPYGTSRIGEAGRYWESMLLGGFVEFWSEPDHPLGRRQPGVPYLFKSGSKNNGTGQQVSRTYIDEFIDNERFAFPIATASGTPVVTRPMLTAANRKETTALRNIELTKNGRVASPPPAQPGDAFRFRSINAGPSYGFAGMQQPGPRYYR